MFDTYLFQIQSDSDVLVLCSIGQTWTLPPPVTPVNGVVYQMLLPRIRAEVIANSAPSSKPVRKSAELFPAALSAGRVHANQRLGGQIEHRGPETGVGSRRCVISADSVG